MDNFSSLRLSLGLLTRDNLYDILSHNTTVNLHVKLKNNLVDIILESITDDKANMRYKNMMYMKIKNYTQLPVSNNFLLDKNINSSDLLVKLKLKQLFSKDYTAALVQERSNQTITAITFSLECPLGKIRMVTPCRTESCRHVECFDAETFLKSNQVLCPICSKSASFDQLVIDEFFQEALVFSDDNVIKIKSDGTWTQTTEL